MDHKKLEDIILSMPTAWLDYPFGKDVAVYKIGPKDDGKMFALVPENADPLKVSLKCDPTLATHLREKYESVMPGYHLNKRHWNTIILSGQLSDDDIKGLVRHSYELVLKTDSIIPNM